MSAHEGVVVDQFTRQAEPFANSAAMRDEEALALLVARSGAGADDTVLDVACGPGLVVAAFAKACRHATGIDITPAMIERARAHAAEQGVANVDWRVGTVLPLPFPSGSFSVVVSRYAFHHFEDPLAVLREMARVARRTVVVADVVTSSDPARAAAFNRMERLRDPSHTRALGLAEWRDLFAQAGLRAPCETFYEVKAELERLLATSFPGAADVPVIRRMFADSLADDGLGMKTRRKGEQIVFSYPIGILEASL